MQNLFISSTDNSDHLLFIKNWIIKLNKGVYMRAFMTTKLFLWRENGP